MEPGYWAGSWLETPGKTVLNRVQDRFGPVILQRTWIVDPEGTWGDSDEVIHAWGMHETVCRLILVAGIMWALLSVAVVAWCLRRCAHGQGSNTVKGQVSFPA
jgi:hypothetical protein